MASLLDPVDDYGRPIGGAPSGISLLTSNPSDLGDFLGYLGGQIQDESLRAQGQDPDTVRFQQGLLADRPELRLPAQPAAPGAGTSDPYVPTMDPEGAIAAANRRFAGNLGVTLGSTFEGGLRARPAPMAGALSVPTDNPAMVSTRIVTNKTPYDPHQANDAVINLDAMKASPDQFAQNMSLLKAQYPIPGLEDVSDPSSIADTAKDFMAGNLRFLQANIPQDVQDVSKQWYRGANNFTQQLSDQYGVSPEAAAGVSAVLSPKTDYNQSADMTHRMINIWSQQQDTPATQAMVDTIQARMPKQDMSWLLGRTLADLQGDPTQAANYIRAFDETYNPQQFRLQSPTGDQMDFARNKDGTPTRLAWQSQPNMVKAVSILQDDSIPSISQQLGTEHKVRNFYNNIVDPDNTRGDITVDTHQVAGDLLQPLGMSSPLVEQGLSGGKGTAYSGATGAGGMYGLHADAVRQAGAEAGMLPREMQSMSWEGLRGLMTPVQKRNPNLIAGANDIWQNAASGGISADDARNQILDLFGGINNPPWYRPGSQDQVAGLGLRGDASGGVGSGSGSGGAGASSGLVAPGGVQGVPARVGSGNLYRGSGRQTLLPAPGYAEGGLIEGGPPSDNAPIGGLVPPTLDADKDGLTAPLPQGGFVLPAGSVSLLGGGSAMRGARRLDRALPPPGAFPAPATMGRLSPGEYVVHPHQLRALRGLLA